MTFREVKKGDYIINVTIPEATPWRVVGKCDRFVLIRRKQKIGKLTALTEKQLKQFQLIHQANYK